MPGIAGGILRPAARRELPSGLARRLIYTFAIGISLYHIIALGIWHPPVDFHSAVHLFTILILTPLVFSYGVKKSTRLPVIDIILAFICLMVGIYFLLNLGTFMERALVITPLSTLDLLVAALLLLLIFEATRRAVGLPFVIIIFGFLLIMYLGPYLPGIWKNPGFNFAEILDTTVWARLQGIWGIPLRMSATYITLFFIFGKLIQHSGLGDLIISICQAVAGGAKGGPAKVAVVGSAMVGSVTGGPATNMIMTGSFTIPMMKRIGYKPYYAGAVEAAASTGASIVPPVMTGIVFIMAELTGTPFVKIMVLAIIPAFFYYLCLLLQVHYQAVILGIVGSGERIAFNEVWGQLKERGHLLIPIIFLIVLLLAGYYPVTAVIWAIPVVPLAACMRKETRMGLRRIMSALGEAIQELAWVAPICALSGIIIVGLFQTGLGSAFSHLVSISAGNSLLLLVVMGGLACIVLGTGVPPTAAYLMTVLIVAPLMVKAGLPVLVAHFFSLYYANLAFITPPIAIGAFVAAGIAGASFWRIGFTAVRLAIVGFIIPVVFVYRPALLLFGSAVEIIWALAASTILVFCLASALEGWMFKRLGILQRIMLLGAGIALIPPNLLVNAGAVIMAGLILLWQVRGKHSFRNKDGPTISHFVQRRMTKPHNQNSLYSNQSAGPF
jgi:TRAP transporter 4TM/12TM fusion protein